MRVGLSDWNAKNRLSELLDGFSARELARLLDDWTFTARADQWPPTQDDGAQRNGGSDGAGGGGGAGLAIILELF